MLKSEELYMRRCLQLALLGRGFVSPNPMVGAVVVYQGQIIGEGYHRQYGSAHAEVNAIAAVADQRLLGESTIYVSLEPCAHWGKTPPCAQLIIDKGIRRVVVGIRDPFAKVAGRGIEMLRQAGIEVRVGVLEEACFELNRTFFSSVTEGRPYITLKWAQSADGFVDRVRESFTPPAQISDGLNAMMVHRMRAENDAILVGTRTAIWDNPALNVRRWDGRNPLRVVLDRSLRISEQAKLLDGSLPTLVFTQQEVESRFNVTYIQIDFEEEGLLQRMLVELARRGVRTLLVEGGVQLHQSFIDTGLWDEARIEVSGLLLGDGVRAAQLPGLPIDCTSLGNSKSFIFRK